MRKLFSNLLSVPKGSGLIAGLCLAAGLSTALWAGPVTEVKGACTSNERWEFGQDLKSLVAADTATKLRSFLNHNEPPLKGFAEAQALSGHASAVVKTLSRYWAARAFQRAGLPVLAARSFNSALETPPTASTFSIQVAVFGCLETLYTTYPVSLISDEALAKLPDYLKLANASEEAKTVLRDAALVLLRRQIRNEVSPDKIETTTKLLAGTGLYEDFAEALLAVARGRAEVAEKAIMRILTAKKLPLAIKEHRNYLRLVLARDLFARNRFAEAVQWASKVERSSEANESALELRGWIELGQENWAKALAISLPLNAPAALTIAATGYIELCRYPEARRFINTFNLRYATTHQWLKKWSEQSKERQKEAPVSGPQAQPLYAFAVSHLQGRAVPVPPPVLAEWLKSPSFGRYQKAFAVTFEEDRAIPKIIEQGENYLADKAAEVASYVETADESELEAASDLLQEPAAPSEGGELAQRAVASVVAKMRDTAIHYEHVVAAAPEWKAQVEAYARDLLARRTALATRIEAHLEWLTARLNRQFTELADNHEFLEAEIFEGAGKDMIRQNALNLSEDLPFLDNCPKKK